MAERIREELQKHCKDTLIKAYEAGAGLGELVLWLGLKVRRLKVTPTETMAKAAKTLFPEHQNDTPEKACAHMDETIGYLDALSEIMEQRKAQVDADQGVR